MIDLHVLWPLKTLDLPTWHWSSQSSLLTYQSCSPLTLSDSMFYTIGRLWAVSPRAAGRLISPTGRPTDRGSSVEWAISKHRWAVACAHIHIHLKTAGSSWWLSRRRQESTEATRACTCSLFLNSVRARVDEKAIFGLNRNGVMLEGSRSDTLLM